jgi:hypothetical protein
MDWTRFRKVNFRLTDSEAQRFAKVYQVAAEKTMGYAPLTQVFRELMGFTPYHLISDKLRESLLEDEKKGYKRKAM